MLYSTFCHIQGIDAKAEDLLWRSGIVQWSDAHHALGTGTGDAKVDKLLQKMARDGAGELGGGRDIWQESEVRAEAGDALWFGHRLKPAEQWRLFTRFQARTAYVDIETTGLSPATSHITTIALYDGKNVYTYVYGKNLQDFCTDICRYDVLVTFNGKCFDVPFLEQFFGQKFDMAHIDLRYVLKKVGLSGGLKKIEHECGIGRNELEGVDGYTAVILWKLYKKTQHQEVLDTLLAYNIEDVLHLETLAGIAYNKNIALLPWQKNALVLPKPCKNPLEPCPAVLRALGFAV